MKGLFIGLTAIDIIYPLDHFPKENSKVRAVGEKMDIGGPATNAAFTFAALGGEATLISWIGQHALSSFICDKLDEYEVKHIDLNATFEKDPIISCVMLNTNSATRTIVTAQVDMDIPVISPNVDLSLYDIICIDGFFGNYVVEILQRNNMKIPVVFDGGSYKRDTDKILPWIEFPIFSGHFQPPNEMVLESYMRNFSINKYAVTHGGDSILVTDESKMFEIEVPNIAAIDTLAAGDIFHGAFSKCILENSNDFESALTKASKIASLSCQFIGPRKWTERL